MMQKQQNSNEEQDYLSLFSTLRKSEKNLKINKIDILLSYVSIFFWYIFLVIFVSIALLPFLNRQEYSIFTNLFAKISFYTIIITHSLILYFRSYLFLKKGFALFCYHDKRSVGIVTQMTMIAFSRKTKQKIYQELQDLLHSLTPTDVTYFTLMEEESLRILARKKEVSRDYPDLMQAILTTLFLLPSFENKKLLGKIAREKPRRKEEEWDT